MFLLGKYTADMFGYFETFLKLFALGIIIIMNKYFSLRAFGKKLCVCIVEKLHPMFTQKALSNAKIKCEVMHLKTV